MTEHFEVDKNLHNCRYVFIEARRPNGAKEDKTTGKIKSELLFIN